MYIEGLSTFFEKSVLAWSIIIGKIRLGRKLHRERKESKKLPLYRLVRHSEKLERVIDDPSAFAN